VLKGLLTDIDGTLTDEKRSLSTAAIEAIRILHNAGIEVVLSSGNTSCLLKGLCRLIGTGGTFIGENGGVFRIGYEGELQLAGNRKVALDALKKVSEYYSAKGIRLELYSQGERYTDVAFANTVPVEEVRSLLSGWPVTVLDTNFAIHVHSSGIDKGNASKQVAKQLGISMDEFIAIGDSENDIGMIRGAGTGCCVANASKDLKEISDYCARAQYGEGFVEIVKIYFPHIFER